MRQARTAGLLALGVLLGAAGCSGKKQDEGPVTFKVTGKVAWARGDEKLTHATPAIANRTRNPASAHLIGQLGVLWLRMSDRTRAAISAPDADPGMMSTNVPAGSMR